MEALSCIDQCFIGDEMLERLPAPSHVGKTMVGGIDLNKPRMRHVAEAVIALSASPDGFTASAVGRSGPRARQSESIHLRSPPGRLRSEETPRQNIVRRIGADAPLRAHFRPVCRAITALLVLRDKAIKPLLAAAQEHQPTRGAQNPRAIDRHYHDHAARHAGRLSRTRASPPEHRQIIFSGFALKRLTSTLLAGFMVGPEAASGRRTGFWCLARAA